MKETESALDHLLEETHVTVESAGWLEIVGYITLLLVCTGLMYLYEPVLGNFGLMLFVLWAILAVLIGVLANIRSRSFFHWSILSFALSPIVAGVILIVLTNISHPAIKKRKKA